MKYTTNYNSKIYYPNAKFISNKGEEIIILGKSIDKNARIVFQYLISGYISSTDMGSLKKGAFQSPYLRDTLGIGYIGEGNYSSKNGNKRTKVYTKWYNMMTRAYDENYKEKHISYKDCTVCEEWHCFQNFAKWHEENYIEGYELDKDLLVEGNKIYSPTACVYIPKKINMFLINKQKRNKTGICGVSFHKRDLVYEVNISCFNTGKNMYLGRSKNIEEAKKIYDEARKEQIIEASKYMRELGFSEDIIKKLR